MSARHSEPFPRRLLCGLVLLVVGWIVGCGQTPVGESGTSSPEPELAGSVEGRGGAPPPSFVDRAAELGLDFVHFNGMSGSLLYSEMMGSGAAFFDADNDGDLDVYLVQGALLGEGVGWDDTHQPPAAEDRPPRDRLFRNDLEIGADGIPRPRFTDITNASGLMATGYGMGVTVFDADGDGWNDLYLTNAGSNQLWRNLGPGGDVPRFVDVSAGSGADLETWSVPALSFDFDRDGRLDLFVGNYLDYRPSADKPCTDELGQRNYCGPLAYPAVADRLLRNLGPDGRGRPKFEDVSRRAGLDATRPGGTLGAIAADFDGDGWQDLYVGNDGTPNHLWMNRGAEAGDLPTFDEQAILAGVAVNGVGHPEASMGIAAADLDHDGDQDLFVTHLGRETNTLYLNDGQGFFSDVSDRSGLGPPSLPLTGFGTVFADFDLDGWLDTLVANGAVKIIKSQALAGEGYPLHQVNLLFRHRGEAGVPRFDTVEAGEGSPFELSEVSRGVAVGDVDNDGDPDLLINNNSGPPRLLINEGSPARPWLGVRLVDESHRDVPGALASIHDGVRAGWRRVETAGSYASSHDPRLLFALDSSESVALVVRWSDGSQEVWADIEPNRYHTLVRGNGSTPDTHPPKETAEESP